MKPKKIPPAPSLLKILPTPCASLLGYLNPLAVKGACMLAYLNTSNPPLNIVEPVTAKFPLISTVGPKFVEFKINKFPLIFVSNLISTLPLTVKLPLTI